MPVSERWRELARQNALEAELEWPAPEPEAEPPRVCVGCERLAGDLRREEARRRDAERRLAERPARKVATVNQTANMRPEDIARGQVAFWIAQGRTPAEVRKLVGVEPARYEAIRRSMLEYLRRPEDGLRDGEFAPDADRRVGTQAARPTLPEGAAPRPVPRWEPSSHRPGPEHPEPDGTGAQPAVEPGDAWG